MAARKDDLALPDPTLRDMQLPPTPPTDEYSNANKTGLQTPPMQTLQQLLTPENTPPGMVLQPPRPLLSRDPSSRAESFRTAREELSHEFLAAVYEAASEVEDEDSSEAESLPNGKDEDVDEEPWRDIPGAFRSTPSNASSRSAARLHTPLGPASSPSTGSSDKFVRPKQYLDTESPPSTGSSRNIVRSKRYRHDTESPSERHKASQDGHGNGSLSYAHSSSSSEEDTQDLESPQADEEDTREEEDDAGNGNESDHERGNETGQDWENHVSYLAPERHEDNAASARASPASSRLSGHGRRVGANGTPVSKGMNNPPFATSSAVVAEQGLLKRASDESSRQRSDNTPSPSVSAQKRRQRAAAADGGAGKEAASPRDTQRMRWLRQHAGTLASPDIPAEFLATPPRNSNDLVYKHIQRANMDRFDAIKNGQAVEAVVIPTDEARSHHLRHVTKRQSLRSMSDNNSSYVPSSAPKRERSLRPKKAPTLQQVPQPGSPESPHNARSVSGSHSLRHEKRPLRGTGRPLQSNDTSPAISRTKEYPSLRQEPPPTAKEPPRLRHSSLPINLDLKTSQASPTASDHKKGERRRTHALRRSSREYRIEIAHVTPEHTPEQKHEPVSTIVETTTFTSPNYLGLEPHSRNRSQGTPLSVSAVSDRTEMEVCEAQNVALYPHSNNSLLVVQHRSKQEHKDEDATHSPAKVAVGSRLANGDGAAHMASLFPETPVQDTPAIAVNGKSIHTVDSPLTNPRAAPMPPVINFIPATPSHEDDEKELVPIEEEEIPSTPQRRGSLAKRARRYSEVVVRPLFGRTTVTRSHNIRPSPTASEKRDERLHPNWVPNSFWQDDDDDDDYYSDPEDSFERLPAGGDTSEHPRSKFPRNMSVRMPGFRGSGGFLLGNSLGVDRHGTNKRRPYIEPPSSNGSGSGSGSAPKQSIRRVASSDSMASHVSGDGRIFVIPGTRTRLQYVGFKPIKDKMRKRRETKEDAAREKRRAELKDQIGMRIVHDA